MARLRVYGYLPVDAQLEDTRRRLEESLWYLGRIRPLPEPQFQLIQQTDWAEAWKVHYHPIAIGQRLMIVPAWLETPSPERTADPHRPRHGFRHWHPPHHTVMPGDGSKLSSTKRLAPRLPGT